MSHTTHFKAADLRRKSMVATVEAILVSFFALMSVAILPSLLLRYLYADQQLFEQPALLEYIPVAAFVISLAYFVAALWGNKRREKQIKQMIVDMEMMADDCGCGSHCNESDENWDEDLKELEEMLADVDSKDTTVKSSKKTAAKSKKTAKK